MIKKFFSRIVEWYRTHFVCYVTMCCANEHIYISRALWNEIIGRIPVENRSELRVFFEKYPFLSYVGMGMQRTWSYRFFVNTDISAIKTPDGDEPFTTQIQFSRFGHLGFQSVQPTPVEILTEYGIADSDFISNHFGDNIRLKVTIDHINGEVCYCVSSHVIGKPYSTNNDE